MANEAGLSPQEQAAWDAQPEVVDTKTMTAVAQPEVPKEEESKETPAPSGEEDVHIQLRKEREEHQRTREQMENYRRATLAKEVEVRTLRDRPTIREVAVAEADVGEEKSASGDDAIEKKILDIQGRANEQAVLRKVLDASNKESYIPELVDRDQYLEILQYLPRGMNRSSPDLIHRALKSAVIAWKADTGRLVVGERAQEKSTAVSEQRGSSGKRPIEAEAIPQLPIRKPVPPTKWYT